MLTASARSESTPLKRLWKKRSPTLPRRCHGNPRTKEPRPRLRRREFREQSQPRRRQPSLGSTTWRTTFPFSADGNSVRFLPYKNGWRGYGPSGQTGVEAPGLHEVARLVVKANGNSVLCRQTKRLLSAPLVIGNVSAVLRSCAHSMTTSTGLTGTTPRRWRARLFWASPARCSPSPTCAQTLLKEARKSRQSSSELTGPRLLLGPAR